jgi:uncharacterized phage-associated protein
MSTATSLAQWIRENYPYQDALTHLKLQKLSFYCFGVALAFECEAALGGEFVFEPWEHGPVNRDIWQEFRASGRGPLPATSGHTVSYSPKADEHIRDALWVYGILDAWTLRQQSHLESPWKKAFDSKRVRIDNADLRAHFQQKFRSGPVVYPEYVLNPGTFLLDGIPVQSFDSLHALAGALRQVQATVGQ